MPWGDHNINPGALGVLATSWKLPSGPCFPRNFLKKHQKWQERGAPRRVHKDHFIWGCAKLQCGRHAPWGLGMLCGGKFIGNSMETSWKLLGNFLESTKHRRNQPFSIDEAVIHPQASCQSMSASTWFTQNKELEVDCMPTTLFYQAERINLSIECVHPIHFGVSTEVV